MRTASGAAGQAAAPEARSAVSPYRPCSHALQSEHDAGGVLSAPVRRRHGHSINRVVATRQRQQQEVRLTS